MRRSTVVLWLVCTLALFSSEARAQELFAQMYRCMPIPKPTLSTTPSNASYGATADKRFLEVQFSYAVAAEHADDTDYKQTAAGSVEWVEVCLVRTEPAPATWSCPWTEDPVANASWLVYHDTLKPAGNEPRWLEFETDSLVTGRERYMDGVPADWRSESESRGKFLFLRVNGQGQPSSTEVAALLTRDGFCPVPYELAAAPSDEDAHFRAYGVEPGVTGPFGLDTCRDGSKSHALSSACVEREAAQFALELLERTHEWQFVRLRDRQAFTLPTWQHGSSPGCSPCATPWSCPCATHVFFLPLWPGIGGQWLSEHGAIQLPSNDDWNDLTPSAPRSGVVSWPFAVLAHEYFHEFQFAWARHEPNLDPSTTQVNGLPPW